MAPAIGFVVSSESRTVRTPPQPRSSLPKSAPAPRPMTSGTSVPLGATSEIAIAEVSGVVIRNETRTNETGPRSGTVSERSKRAPIGALMCAGRVRLRRAHARARP